MRERETPKPLPAVERKGASIKNPLRLFNRVFARTQHEFSIGSEEDQYVLEILPAFGPGVLRAFALVLNSNGSKVIVQLTSDEEGQPIFSVAGEYQRHRLVTHVLDDFGFPHEDIVERVTELIVKKVEESS